MAKVPAALVFLGLISTMLGLFFVALYGLSDLLFTPSDPLYGRTFSETLHEVVALTWRAKLVFFGLIVTFIGMVAGICLQLIIQFLAKKQHSK